MSKPLFTEKDRIIAQIEHLSNTKISEPETITMGMAQNCLNDLLSAQRKQQQRSQKEVFAGVA